MRQTKILNPDNPLDVHDGAGGRIIRLHYRADDEKGEGWAAATKIGIPIAEWQREMEGDISILHGAPVFPEFNPRLHEHSCIEMQNDSILIGGWDAGTAGHDLAFELVEFLPRFNQSLALMEVINSEGEHMITFCQRVRQEIRDKFPGVASRIRHFGDPTVTTASGTDGRSNFKIAQQYGGMVIKPSSCGNVLSIRHDAVVKALATVDDGVPWFCIDTEGCPVLTLALRGAYKWQERLSPEYGSLGNVRRLPLKNAFSHIADALQYALVAVSRLQDSQVKKRGSDYGRKTVHSHRQAIADVISQWKASDLADAGLCEREDGGAGPIRKG